MRTLEITPCCKHRRIHVILEAGTQCGGFLELLLGLGIILRSEVQGTEQIVAGAAIRILLDGIALGDFDGSSKIIRLRPKQKGIVALGSEQIRLQRSQRPPLFQRDARRLEPAHAGFRKQLVGRRQAHE